MGYPVRRLCQTLKVHPSGYYAWLVEPESVRAKEDQRLLGLISIRPANSPSELQH